MAAALAAGMLISGLIIALFTRERRKILIIVLSQPLIIICSLGIITMAGRPLDTWLLAGMAVGTGMILDAGLLITEHLGKGERSIRTIAPPDNLRDTVHPSCACPALYAE